VNLAATILALCTLASGAHIRHVRERPDPAAWARHTATSIQVAAQYTRQDPYLLTALFWHESRFDEQAVSRNGSFGVAQINPWAWPQHAIDSTTPRRQIVIGARVLSFYRRKCGAEKWRRVYAYRHGHCGRVPVRTTIQVLETYRGIRR
jgi:soluble lytic murein transglycosylase-like protein